MTESPIDEVRAAEAMRIHNTVLHGSVAITAARLGREGWVPPVDPIDEAVTNLLAARGVVNRAGSAFSMPTSALADLVGQAVERGRDMERARTTLHLRECGYAGRAEAIDRGLHWKPA